MMTRRPRRCGAALVEAAFVYPIVVVIILAVIVLGAGVFRKQQVTHAAREASRWAAVHGADYAKDANVPLATADDVYAKAVVPNAVGLDGPNLTCAVAWSDPLQRASVSVVEGGKVVSRSTTVSVTVTYRWEAGVFGVMNLTSTSVATMNY